LKLQPCCHVPFADTNGQIYHLYLNGLYWGLPYGHERSDDDFAASYFGGSNTDYDVLKNTTFGLQVVSGDTVAWSAALALANTGLTNNAQYEELQQYVDMDNLIDYMIVNHWVGNDDWPQHNWYLTRKRDTGEGFKFLIWDAEHVLKDVNVNRTTVNAGGSPAQIYLALINNTEFRLRYADRLQKHFFNSGLFYTDPNPANALWDPAHPERNVPASYYMKRINEIDTAIVDESARWGGYLLNTNYTRNGHWLRELNNLLGYTNNAGNTAN
ncbi:MAG: putative secreted protein, partial [Pedosphaera sp.]|nr:putative secreted protein [Pedosphaera sp.]